MKFTLSNPIKIEEACDLLQKNTAKCPDVKNIEVKNAYAVRQIKIKSKLNNTLVMFNEMNGDVGLNATVSMMVYFLFVLFITIPISISQFIAYSYDYDETYMTALVIGAIIGITANIVLWRMRQPEKNRISSWVQETLIAKN